MNSATHISQDNLLLFALQFLSKDEARDARVHIVGCDDCRRQLGWIQGDLAGYAMTSEMVDVPAGSLERLMTQVGKEKKFYAPLAAAGAVTAGAVTAGAVTAGVVSNVHGSNSGNVVSMADYVPKAQRRSSPLAWAGWAVAAGLAVTAGLEYRQTNRVRDDLSAATVKLTTSQDKVERSEALMQTLTDEGAMHVSLNVPTSGAPVEPKPEAHASYLAKKGSLVFVASHLQPLDANKTYELWVLPADKSAPVPAGTFRPDARGRASMVISELPRNLAAGGFGVTIEPQGGSSTPTMPIVLAGL